MEVKKVTVYPRLADPKLASATFLIVQAVLAKEIAAHVPDPLKSNITKSAEKTIAWIIDDYCGTSVNPHRPPKALPGPTGLNLALAVATFANLALKSGNLQAELMKVAGAITQKAYGASL